MIELTIKIKDEESTYIEKHLIYEDLLLTIEEGPLRQLVEKARKNFSKPMTDPEVIIKAVMSA